MTSEYARYCHNRRLFPAVSPARWKRVFNDVDEMEKRYQKETGVSFADGPSENWFEELGHARVYGERAPLVVSRRGGVR